MESEEIFSRASVAWDQGKRKQAFDLFMRAALLGNASAQHNLAYFFDEGIAVRKNVSKALFWYRKAWRNDRQTGTCANIALLYARSGNSNRAVAWWKKAIKLGDGDAALDFGKFLIESGDRRRRIRGIELLRKIGKFRRTTPESIAEARSMLRKWRAVDRE